MSTNILCASSPPAVVKSTLSTACNDAKDQNSPTVLAIGQIANNYNDIRALLTIKEDGSSKYCVTNLLSSAEVGPAFFTHTCHVDGNSDKR